MNNEPAFPALHSMTDGVSYSNGMTLRDYFAAQAITGLLSGNHSISITDENIILRYPNAFAKFSYQIADAMLEVRKQ